MIKFKYIRGTKYALASHSQEVSDLAESGWLVHSFKYDEGDIVTLMYKEGV